MHAIPRKRRKNSIINKMGKLFSDAMHEGNYRRAGKIAFKTALIIGGVEGIKNAIEDANSFIRRKKRRKGL